MVFRKLERRVEFTMNTTSKLRTWSGTAEVVPQKGNDALGAAKGAYVAVVGLATDHDMFCARVAYAMSAMDFDLIDLDDFAEVAMPLKSSKFDPVLAERIGTLSPSNPIEVGTFHAFSDEDET
jgi:hypothetical protein